MSVLTTDQIHEAVRVLHSMGYSVSKDGREYSLPELPVTTVYFVSGPWHGQSSVIGGEPGPSPLFLKGDRVGGRYWLDPKSDPPTYHWDCPGLAE